jgi:hemolysin activation/secretion protein
LTYGRKTLARALLTCGAVFSAHSAFAQPVMERPFGQFQQIPPTPTPPKAMPDIQVDRKESAAPPPTAPAGPRFQVTALHVTGASVFTESELVAASGFRPGEELDLSGLQVLAGRITRFYGRHGYFVAQAYVPPQDIQNGAATIAVIEGRYGRIDLNNESRVSDRLARAVLSGLDPGEVVATAPLERRLLLLSDLPGVAVQSTIAPGEAVGTSDLLVTLSPGRRVNFGLEADNAGNPYTGRWRGGGTVYFNEPFGQGDVASLRILSSGSGLTYGRAAYQLRLREATLGVAYAHLDYKFGREFKPLNARGTADVFSLYGSYPIIRSRRTNLSARASYDYRAFEDKIGAIGSSTHERAHVVTLGLAGDHHDRFLGGGWTSFTADLSIGDHHIKSPLVRADDALTARTEGGYQKLWIDVARLQSLAGPLSLYARVRGQLASQNLDSSEKMGLGGAYAVRAYAEGEAYGDEGYVATAELRLSLPPLSERIGGQVTALAFVDQGFIKLNKSPWAPGDNDRALSAAGVGVSWADNRGLLVKLEAAWRLGDERAATVPDRSPRVWFQISKFF